MSSGVRQGKMEYRPVRDNDVCYIVEASGLDVMKVGFTRNIMRRLTFIQTYCPAPLEVMAVIPGSRRLEAKMHSQVASLRVIGEWYTITDKIRGSVGEIRLKFWDQWQEFLFDLEREPIARNFRVADLTLREGVSDAN